MNKNSNQEQEEKFKQALEYAKNQQYEEYLAIIQKLAKEGHHGAEMHMGIAYSSGHNPLKLDYQESFKWHFKALEGKNPDNFYWLGLLYDPDSVQFNADAFLLSIQNKEISQDYYAKAFDGFKQRAETGDVIAMYRLGELFSRGEGTNHDLEKAKYWFDQWRVRNP
jgi:hypothetical protein